MKIKYTSKQGEYIAGIPARDLDEDDWAALTKEQRKDALASGLYVKPEQHDAPKKAVHEKAVAKEEANTETHSG